MNTVIENLQVELDQMIRRDKNYSLWMAKLIISLPDDPAYKKLKSSVREQIEEIIAAVE